MILELFHCCFIILILNIVEANIENLKYNIYMFALGGFSSDKCVKSLVS